MNPENTIELRELLRRNLLGPNRLDVIVRYLYIDYRNGNNSFGGKLYEKMQKLRLPKQFKEGIYEKKFNDLIDSFCKFGFSPEYPLLLSKDMKLVDGSHRLACSIYYGNPNLMIPHKTENKTANYDLSWFEKNFSKSELDIIKKKWKEIMERYGLIRGDSNRKDRGEFVKEIESIYFSKKQTFGQDQFYQSFKELSIGGQRDTEQRIKNYELDRYLHPEFTILNLGSNLGFLDIQIAKKVKKIISIENNHTLTEIHKKTADFFGVENIEIHNCKVQEFKTNIRYDFLMALAVHKWLGYKNSELVTLLDSQLKPGGYLLLESQDINKGDPDYEEIKRRLEENFKIIYEKTSSEELPTKIINRKFSLWRKTPNKNLKYITICNNYYIPGVIALRNSLLSVQSTVGFEVLCFGLNNKSRETLEKENICYSEIEPIQSRRQTPRFKNTYTKLSIFNLNYDKVIFLDADSIVLRNIDHLFNIEAPFAAPTSMGQSKGYLRLEQKDYPIFNTGVMVVNPNPDLFQDMMRKKDTLDSYDGSDQGFLNSYFGGKNQYLDIKYNTLKRIFKFNRSLWNKIVDDIYVLV